MTRGIGVVLVGLLFLFRIYLITHLFHSRPYTSSYTAPRTFADANSAPVNYRNATIAAATDSSGWILFTSSDPKTGQRVRHARLTAASDVITNGHPAPPNVLEVMEQGPSDHYIRATLQAPSTCPGITSVHAVFGKTPMTLDVKPVEHEAGCTFDMLDYPNVLQSLRDADALTISAGNGPDIRFEVAGLSWD